MHVQIYEYTSEYVNFTKKLNCAWWKWIEAFNVKLILKLTSFKPGT